MWTQILTSQRDTQRDDVQGARNPGHLFLKCEDWGRPPRTHDILELDLGNTKHHAGTSRCSVYIYLSERRKGGRKRRKKKG